MHRELYVYLLWKLFFVSCLFGGLLGLARVCLPTLPVPVQKIVFPFPFNIKHGNVCLLMLPLHGVESQMIGFAYTKVG